MPVRNRSTLSSFDADAALEAALNAVNGVLYSFCEYDTESFRPLYVDDRTIAMYENREHMIEHFDRIHTNIHMDFMQIELFRNTLFPVADRVEYIATAMDFLTVLRVCVDDQGLFLAIGPDEPVTPIVEAITDTVGWPPNQNS